MISPRQPNDGGIHAPCTTGTGPAESERGGTAAADRDESPGVPGFRTWRGVYAFVLGFFVLLVVLLTVFSRYHR